MLELLAALPSSVVVSHDEAMLAQRETRSDLDAFVPDAGMTGSVTIPQVFVDGEFVGGCSETMAAFRAGRLDGHRANDAVIDPPEQFLPGWIHAR